MVNSEISLQNTITDVFGSLFRRTVYAKAGDYTRVVNPARALMAVIRSEFSNCNHKKAACMISHCVTRHISSGHRKMRSGCGSAV